MFDWVLIRYLKPREVLTQTSKSIPHISTKTRRDSPQKRGLFFLFTRNYYQESKNNFGFERNWRDCYNMYHKYKAQVRATKNPIAK